MTEQSLYERLGGDDAIDAAVTIFYDRILADPAVSHHFSNTDMERQRKHQYNFMRYAFGGPNQYSGRSMRKAHEHLNLTEDDFNAVAGHLLATLQQLNVPQDLCDEVLAVVGSTKDDVLNH